MSDRNEHLMKKQKLLLNILDLLDIELGFHKNLVALVPAQNRGTRMKYDSLIVSLRGCGHE